MTLLALRGVSRRFGSRTALRDVTLSVAPGTVTLLAGGNGAGKTTLLRLMAGLLKPSEGCVERACPEERSGYLGHATFLYPGLSALENLAFWQGLHGGDTDAATLEAALDRVGLAAHGDEKAGGFSRGMAQRLNLARVLLQRPDLLLLDEPGTGLDVAARALLHREIAAARDRGAGLVWVSHDLLGDLPLADRVVALAGRQVAYDGPAAAYDAPTGDGDAGGGAC